MARSSFFRSSISSRVGGAASDCRCSPPSSLCAGSSSVRSASSDRHAHRAVRAPTPHHAGFAALLHALLLAVACLRAGFGCLLFLGEHVSHIGRSSCAGLRVDVLLVVCDLDLAATHCLGDGLVHRKSVMLSAYMWTSPDFARRGRSIWMRGAWNAEALLVGVRGVEQSGTSGRSGPRAEG